MSDHEPKVILRDVRDCKLCFPGGRVWAKANGIDWSDFLRYGVAITYMESLHDAYADRLVAQARKRLGLVK